MAERGLCVLHVAAMEDAEALTALSRTTHVIAALGVDQVLLALEDRPHSDPTWARSLAIEVRPLRYAGLSIFRRIRALQSELLRLSRERTPYTVHLHGVMACLLGLRALKGAIPRARVLCSPHAERLGSLWLAGLLGRVLQSHLPTFNYAPLATSLVEAQMLSRLLNRSVDGAAAARLRAFLYGPPARGPRAKRPGRRRRRGGSRQSYAALRAVERTRGKSLFFVAWHGRRQNASPAWGREHPSGLCGGRS